jgi:hypothetical protein
MPPSDPHSFSFEIDGAPYSTQDKTLTPRELLSQFAHLDPDSHYLIEINGRDQKSFEGAPDQTIHMHQHQKFITASLGPTPVS